MKFRTRIQLALMALTTFSVLALGWLVRAEMTRRITAQYERRVSAFAGSVEHDLHARSAAIATALSALCTRIIDDNRFRSAALNTEPGARRYVLDYAGTAMQLMQLSMLQVQDAEGRIVSSGHFRNAFDRVEPLVPRALASAGAGKLAVVKSRRPEGSFLALARVDSFRIAGHTFYVSGGIELDDAFLRSLSREPTVRVAFENRGRVEGSHHNIASRLRVLFIDPDADEVHAASIVVSHNTSELSALRRSVTVWIAVVLGFALLLSTLASSIIAARITRPLTALSEKTRRVDLDHLDINFDTARTDEFGSLSRLLAAMTQRLRSGAVQLKEAERRATLGDLARQVNHDIKNGLIPVRNVFRHLGEVASERPDKLAGVFHERESTVASGVDYLEALASNYARLSPQVRRVRCDVSAIARRVAGDRGGREGVEMITRIDPGAYVVGDALSLRRVLENLADNAIDSLGGGVGRVTISIGRVVGGVEVAVEDTGPGMNAEEQARIFDDFYTTKEHGTGLGLSVVRRLVMDLDGTVRVESEPGRGTRFVVEFPAQDTASTREQD